MAANGFLFQEIAANHGIENLWDQSDLSIYDIGKVPTEGSLNKSSQQAMGVISDFQSDLRDMLKLYCDTCLLDVWDESMSDQETAAARADLKQEFNELGQKLWPLRNEKPSPWKLAPTPKLGLGNGPTL